MNSAPHKYRAASKGKPFTSRERINLILAEKARDSRRAEIRTAVLEAKNQIEKEREARELAARKRAALIANPTVKKIKQKKDGTCYFQPRVDGKLSSAVMV